MLAANLLEKGGMLMNLAGFIDHTLLKPVATVDDIRQLCQEALDFNFAAVCVNPCCVKLAAHLLAGSAVKTTTVIGFPLGANVTAVKVLEAEQAVLDKADELDMVINLGAAKAGVWAAVLEDIRQVVQAAPSKVVKVIIETALLTDAEKRQACNICLQSGAHFVKTSTGYGPSGATVEDVALIKSIVGDQLGIKAAGGIRTRDQAEQLIAAGATRIGTSAAVNFVK